MFNEGHELEGQAAAYRVLRSSNEKVELGRGRNGITYLAEVTAQKKPVQGLTERARVVIKIPAFDHSRSAALIRRMLAELHTKFEDEWAALQQLIGLTCAAGVLDFNAYPHLLPSGQEVHPLFMVQEYVPGRNLAVFMDDEFGNGSKGSFRGIDSVELFFEYASKLAKALLQVHQRQVVHGDIWQENILVRRHDEEQIHTRNDRSAFLPVFIDFGQALLRDLAPPAPGTAGSSKRLVPPEGSGSITADIYCLGGVLYYLATGEDWENPRIEDADHLKAVITLAIRRSNRRLYDANRGVIDVIARCLRYDEAYRLESAGRLLDEIVVLSGQDIDIPDLSELSDELRGIRAVHGALFERLANHHLRTLQLTLGNMTRGVYDLSGSHEEIVRGMMEFLGSLGSDDTYLTLSIPSFWNAASLGRNGRVLAMNAVAAQRGVTIRRIIPVTTTDINDDLQAVLYFHWRIKKDLSELDPPIETQFKELDHKGYWTGLLELDTKDLESMKARGMSNYGLLLNAKGGVVIFPIYRRDGVIHTIQFRTAPDLVQAAKADFLGLLARAELQSWASFEAPGPLD
jgi:serine/threonine protein kinase